MHQLAGLLLLLAYLLAVLKSVAAAPGHGHDYYDGDFGHYDYDHHGDDH